MRVIYINDLTRRIMNSLSGELRRGTVRSPDSCELVGRFDSANWVVCPPNFGYGTVSLGELSEQPQ